MLHLIEYIGVLFNLDVVSEVKFSHIPLLSILAQWSTRSIAGGSSHTNILLMGYDICQNSPGAGRLSGYILKNTVNIPPFAWLYVPRILLIAATFGIAGCKYFFRRGRGESQELRFSGVSGQADKLGVTHIQPAVEAFVENI